MQDFFVFFYVQNMNLAIFLITVAILFWAFFISLLKNQKIYNTVNSLIFISSVIFIIYATLFRKEMGNTDIELRPFYIFVMAKSQPEYYRSFIMNVFLFVPMGLSVPYVLSKGSYKRKALFTIGFTCVLSMGIEFVQYYYHLGRCETDDVIANTLGAAVGTLSYLLYIFILKNRQEGLMNNKISENQKLLLDLCAKSLLNKQYDLPENIDYDKLIDESKKQTVFAQIFSLVKEKCDKNTDKLFSQIVAKNIRVEFGHNEVHKALTENNIPYVVFKGVASASYYPEPTLRMMGDVDILVSPNNIIKANAALESIGFITKDKLEKEGHIAYKRRDGLVCELHHHINGIPQNAAGEKIKEYFADIYEQSQEYKMSNGCCIVPDKFHHGLILLLHTATHLTREGVGLRHLCDWAVFVNSIPNDNFVSLFEKPLKEAGLWRFAQLLTLCCTEFLGCSPKQWAGEYDATFIESIVADILNSGNFGLNDLSRYNHIKYISNRKTGDVSKTNPILQLFSSINSKTYNNCKFTKKHKILLPIGWVIIICKYIYMVIIGKRTPDFITTINNAQQRKNVYKEFCLFENDK